MSLLERKESRLGGGGGDDSDASVEQQGGEFGRAGASGQRGGEELAEADVLRLVAMLDPEGDEEEQEGVCGEVEMLIRESPEGKRALMRNNQVIPLLEMLDARSPLVATRVLRVIHEAITDRLVTDDGDAYTGAIGVSLPILERMCTVGLLHRLLRLCRVPGGFGQDCDSALTIGGLDGWRMVQQQAALVLHSVCWGRDPTHARMIVACGGIPVLVGLLSADPPVNHVALDCLWAVTNLPPPTPKLDLCRLLARAKGAEPLSRLLGWAFFDGSRLKGVDSEGWTNLAWQQADRVSSLLVLFSLGDAVVRSDLARDSTLEVLLGVIEGGHRSLPPRLHKPYLKVLRCLRHLASDTAALEPLQRAGACRILVPQLQGSTSGGDGGVFAQAVESQAMFTLYKLCKVSKERREQAARAGIVPHAQRLAARSHPLQHLAVPILCDLAHAGPDARAELWRHGAFKTFLGLLEDPAWQQIALNALATWVTSEGPGGGRRHSFLEEELAKPDCVEAVVDCVDMSDTRSMAGLLAPVIKILSCEPLNKVYAHTKLCAGLLLRMEHPEAVVRKGILEVLQSIYAASDDPRAFIMAHDLIAVVERLVSEDESRLVQEQGKLLLKAMYINVVL